MKLFTLFVATMTFVGLATAADKAVVKTPDEAFEKAQASALPDGVRLTGVTEKIDPPAGIATSVKKDTQEDKDYDSHGDNDKKEQLEWGLGGWGNFGGWGGFGPYRFGFMCGGIPGWAYPIGYWNLYGAGLYGGGCGLGVPFGGLYYC
ncbi:hypothetical protein Plhal710r2_c042g0142431 [Plasmopara halstedii]